MIKHICMFKMKETANGKSGYENALAMAENLKDFDKKVESLKKFEVKVNSKDAPDSNYELVLICDFDDIEGLNAYQVHPEHVAVANGKVRPFTKTRLCLDYEI